MQQQPDYREIPTSQIPAMRLLANLGFKPLTPEEVMLERKENLRTCCSKIFCFHSCVS